jgi:hypothetical protein
MVSLALGARASMKARRPPQAFSKAWIGSAPLSSWSASTATAVCAEAGTTGRLLRHYCTENPARRGALWWPRREKLEDLVVGRGTPFGLLDALDEEVGQARFFGIQIVDRSALHRDIGLDGGGVVVREGAAGRCFAPRGASRDARASASGVRAESRAP